MHTLICNIVLLLLFLVVMEEMTGYESLQHRIIHLSKVDHGITCAIARQLASLHRGTAIYNINEEKYKEIQQMFG